jgi:hypothetical protein
VTHTYDDRPCPACGDLDGCHIPGKVKRVRWGSKRPHSSAYEAHYGQTYPKKVCLCGSSRFKEKHLEVMRDLTLNGDIVLAMGCFGHADASIDMDGPVKDMLDDLHLRKIDEADEVFVVNPKTPTCDECGKPCKIVECTSLRLSDQSICCKAGVVDRPYIGTSTRNEIAYAQRTGKPVRYLEEPHD